MIEIDEAMLVRLAGVRAFGRGLHCFEEGGVRDVITTDTTTNALIQDARQHLSALSHEDLLDEFLDTIEQDRALCEDMLKSR